jgi:hypothetical protein
MIAREVRRVQYLNARVVSQRKPRDDAEAAAITALYCPEQVGVCASVGDANGAIGSHDFGFEQPRRGRAEIFREGPEPAALDHPGNADGRTATTLDVAAGLGRHGIVGVDPDCARPDGNRGLRNHASRTTIADKGVAQDDVVHRPRPDRQRVGRV